MDECSLEVCIICMESMNDPRILPCAHSFCLKCLESSTISSNSSTCRKCLMNFEIPQGGLKNLKKNAFIEQLSILKQNGINCDSCKKIQAFCVDCSLNYCSSCLEHHARIPTTSSHQLQPATSTKVEKHNNKYLHCVEHSELMTLICENCRISICSHCLTLNHKNHNFMHISDYLDSAKVKFEEHLKVKEELRQCVFKNMKTSEDMIRDNELKASNLEKEFEQRGENAKKIIDSIVASLQQTIDEKLKQKCQVADHILLNLNKMQKNLTKQIETLKHELKNVRYATVTKTEFNTLEHHETIPSYSENFSISLHLDEDLNKIEKFFRSIERAPLVKENILDNNIETITLYKGELYGVEKLPNGLFRIKSYYASSITNLYIKFHEHLIEICNLLVIDDVFFVSGICTNGDHCILKSVHESHSFHIYYHQPFIEKFSAYMLIMSKSICGNIIVNYFKKLVHLSNNGVVTKKIILPFPVHDVLQLDNKSYAVCGDGEICIIGDNGNVFVRHSYDSSYNGIKHALTSPRFVTKDRHGNFYVYDSSTCKVFVLICCLKIKLSFDVECPLREIVYDDERNVLMVLRGDKSMLAYAI